MRTKVLTILFLLLYVVSSANTEQVSKEHSKTDTKDKKSLRQEIKDDIKHHVKDSYYFSFAHNKESHKYYGFPLPVI